MSRVLLFLAAAAWACAQATPDVRQAELEVQRVQALVKEGALPGKTLLNAEVALAEARDSEILQSTLYAQLKVEDLTEEQTAKMLAAAARQLDRQRDKVAQIQSLVEQGAMARTGLTPYLEELDRRRHLHEEAASRARVFEQMAAIVRAEQELALRLEEAPQDASQFAERFDGEGVLSSAHLRMTILAYEREFGRPMPISARGETALHRSLGFDHRGRVDVALYPDSKEGAWLRRHLEFLQVPYYAFRGFVRGKSTAAHIHIGPPSGRIKKTD